MQCFFSLNVTVNWCREFTANFAIFALFDRDCHIALRFFSGLRYKDRALPVFRPLAVRSIIGIEVASADFGRFMADVSVCGHRWQQEVVSSLLSTDDFVSRCNDHKLCEVGGSGNQRQLFFCCSLLTLKLPYRE